MDLSDVCGRAWRRDGWRRGGAGRALMGWRQGSYCTRGRLLRMSRRRWNRCPNPRRRSLSQRSRMRSRRRMRSARRSFSRSRRATRRSW